MAVTLIRGSTQILAASITADRFVSSLNLPTAQLQDGAKLVYTDGTRPMTANLSMGGFVLTNLGTASAATDAVNKSYVDAAINGLSLHFARLASTVNIATLSGLLTIDGVTTVAGNEVLLVGQTTQSQNGLWIVNSGAWTRPSDWSGTVTEGQYVIIDNEGTANKNTKWFSTNTTNIVVGTTAATFVQDLSGTIYTAGNGITLSSNQFAAKLGNGTAFDGSNAITVTPDPARLLQTVAAGVGIKDGTAGQIILANASGNAAYATLSGDVTITSGGVATVSSAGGSGFLKYTNIISNETPGGSINGTNTAFTLAFTPYQLNLELNGVTLEPGSGNDYTISGAAITMLFAPLAGDKLRAYYFK